MRRIGAVMLAAFVAALTTTCGGGGGVEPPKTGSVVGIVNLPFDLTAALIPADTARVHLFGGDYSQTKKTDANGRFVFDQIPVRTMTLVATYGSCLADTQKAISVPENDTLRLNVNLTASQPTECLILPYAGAARMEIASGSNRGILLYDTLAHVTTPPKPAIVVVDLMTGEGTSHQFADLQNVYDMALAGADVAVFNFKSADGYGLRFWNVTTMSKSREDIIYEPDRSTQPGQLTLDDTHTTVFVTAGRFSDPWGSVYAAPVSGGDLNDADDDLSNDKFAFDNGLVAGSLGWAYGIAFDPAAGEILVGNRLTDVGQPPSITAIDWSKWGSFHRGSPSGTPGVRVVPMDAGVTGFAVEFWDFAGGKGVAAKSLSGVAAMLLYPSAGTTYSEQLVESGVELRSNDHALTIIPTRQSWFSIFDDPSRPDGVRKSVEERSLSTLARLRRFETRHAPFNLEDPIPDARAFAFDNSTGGLYVAYRNLPLLEVFALPAP
ncbi:MAG: carboxypeptidase regulatory-like domain-containing protein [candidate division Zixibacteria bacterium]|nr:carboxypeptidase regulatory-like domain-containing protein [candidate division Zixibacteria bacterium]